MTRQEETAEQIAALPIRWDDTGNLNVLLVTSRDTGRWVMPKGWTMDNKKPWHAAEIEALEEAGAVGYISERPIGVYHYDKRMSRPRRVRCRVTAYPMVVKSLRRDWKEKHQRKRHWFSPQEAAKLVQEKELAALLRDLGKETKKREIINDMRKAI